MIRVAINGFGRIGRAILRLGFNDPDLQFVAINDPIPADNLAYLLKHDSVHGQYELDVRSTKESIVVGGEEIQVRRNKNPLLLPWRKLGVAVVIEASGRFRSMRAASLHRLAGAKRVVITAIPSGGWETGIPLLIPGVNESSYSGEAVVSAASCSANAAGAITKLLHDRFGIRGGFLTAVHAYTRDQQLLDGGHPRDWRRGRAAALNIVPSESDAALAVAAAIPGLNGRLSSMTLRVPVPDGSLMCMAFQLEKPADRNTVHALVKEKADTELFGIVSISGDPLTSRDVVNDTNSIVLDPHATPASFGSLLAIAGWYDHEWGYAARVLDVVKLIA